MQQYRSLLLGTHNAQLQHYKHILCLHTIIYRKCKTNVLYVQVPGRDDPNTICMNESPIEFASKILTALCIITLSTLLDPVSTS